MADPVLPSIDDLVGMESVDELRAWSGLPQSVWASISHAVGHVQTPLVLAMITVELLREALSTVRITAEQSEPRALTPVEVIQTALLWRAARKKFGLADLDPLVYQSAPAAQQVHAAQAPAPEPTGPTAGIKKVKMSQIADQMDDSEVALITQAGLDEAYENYRQMVGSDPLENADPTPEQVTVMINKVVSRNEAPYADFSVLTPFGRRVQKAMKAKSWVLQRDGTWQSLEVPGPPSFEAWAACWKVFRTIMMMLRYPADVTNRARQDAGCHHRVSRRVPREDRATQPRLPRVLGPAHAS